MKIKFIVLLVMIFTLAMKSDRPAYILFDSQGKSVKYEKLKDAIKDADVVFFGELHNNPICHWLELQVTKDLFGIRKDNLILGAEMFEADNQLVLTEYLAGIIKQKSFESQARLWPNYKTDYKPLVEFAKENNLTFIATNIPRRYASIVHASGFEGLDSLSDEAKRWFPQLPILYDSTLPAYMSMLDMGGKSAMGKSKPDRNLPKAQAVKDATMAYFIMKNHSSGKTFLHFNGSYHSDDYEGIVWYLKQQKPQLKLITISSVQQKDIGSLEEENIGKADFIFCIPEDMTTTY